MPLSTKPLHAEMRHLLGDNLFDLPHKEWVRRKRTLQPVFTKQRVRTFSGLCRGLPRSERVGSR